MSNANPTKSGGETRCSGRVNSFCSTYGICLITLVTSHFTTFRVFNFILIFYTYELFLYYNVFIYSIFKITKNGLAKGDETGLDVIIKGRKLANFQWDDDDVRFVLDQQAYHDMIWRVQITIHEPVKQGSLRFYLTFSIKDTFAFFLFSILFFGVIFFRVWRLFIYWT